MPFFKYDHNESNAFPEARLLCFGRRSGFFSAGILAAVILLTFSPAGAIDGKQAGAGFSDLATTLNGRIQEHIIKKWIESHRLTRYNNIPAELSIRYTNPRVKVTYEMIVDPDEKFKVRVKKVEPLVRY